MNIEKWTMFVPTSSAATDRGPFAGAEWIYAIKYDGFPALAINEDDAVSSSHVTNRSMERARWLKGMDLQRMRG